MTFFPMILILEDEEEAQNILEQAFLAQEIGPDNLFVANTVQKAMTLLRSNHFHGISIDQQLPMADDGPVLSDHGLAFTESKRWPLTKRVVYTNHADNWYANRVGLAGAIYREKATVSDAGNRRTYYDYAAEFVQDLRAHYVEEALRAASSLLPYSLATPALRAAEAKHASNWPFFFRNFAELRERLLKLALSITLASQNHKFPWRNGVRVQDLESGLRENWRPTPLQFRRFVTSPGWESGEALFTALVNLRKLRNAVEHHDRDEYVASDFEEHDQSILAIINLLAFFCEFPIMHAPRFHPTKRGLLSFHKMGPNKTKVEDLWEADFDPPPLDDAALYMPWRDANGPRLLSLAPWICARRDATKELEFRLMLGTKPEVI